MRFAALPPSELIERWIRDANQRLTRLEADREHLLAGLQEELSQPDPHDARKFTVFDSPERIFKLLNKRIGAAHKEIVVTASGPTLAMVIEGGIDRDLKRAKERGVKVRLVTDISRGNLFEAKHFAGLLECRHSEAPVTNRTVVIDRTGALVFVSGQDGLGSSGQAHLAIWSTEPTFVRLARDYHARLWSRGERAEARLVELEAPSKAVLPVVRGQEEEPFQRLKEIAQLGMTATGVQELRLELPELIETVARQLGRQIAEQVDGNSPQEIAHSLSTYYHDHTLGRLSVIRDKPLTLKVSQCFACTSQSPEIGRVLCPKMILTVLETRLGPGWEVSKPDPRRHAQAGCVFEVTPA
jgi:sugar-specific transcriptional regulator TrmB